jgi:hypothetical protein
MSWEVGKTISKLYVMLKEYFIYPKNEMNRGSKPK